ncbi:nudC domain-containing protein 2 [Lepeophtheirus salmonis]|nr:nudC domain-containing protein 2-like [Lepeophtheirus salmonis]
MNFDESSGTVNCKTDWGEWYQTVKEVVILVNVEPGTKSRDVEIKIKPKRISCKVRGALLFEGIPYETVMEDDSIWTIEENKLIRIALTKAESRSKETSWLGLLKSIDGEEILFKPDPYVYNEMRKKLDLEQFQIENPGMNFSNAKLDKNYEDKYLKQAARALEDNAPI